VSLKSHVGKVPARRRRDDEAGAAARCRLPRPTRAAGSGGAHGRPTWIVMPIPWAFLLTGAREALILLARLIILGNQPAPRENQKLPVLTASEGILLA
jgi:hypothetical protein